jgi:hypothetical protein
MMKIKFFEYELTIENNGEIKNIPADIRCFLKTVSPGCSSRPQCDMQYYRNLKAEYPNGVTLISHEPYEEPPFNPNVIY